MIVLFGVSGAILEKGIKGMTIRANQLVRGAVLAIVALAAVATTAIAAQKVVDIKIVNESTPVGDVFTLPEEICGVSGPFGGEFVINQLSFTLWNDDHFVFRTTNSVRLTDGAGNLIMRDRIAAHEEGTDPLPFNSTANLVAHCTPNTNAPGKLYEFHVTFTVGEDGTFTRFHGEFCDPTAYPFC